MHTKPIPMAVAARGTAAGSNFTCKQSSLGDKRSDLTDTELQALFRKKIKHMFIWFELVIGVISWTD